MAHRICLGTPLLQNGYVALGSERVHIWPAWALPACGQGDVLSEFLFCFPLVSPLEGGCSLKIMKANNLLANPQQGVEPAVVMQGEGEETELFMRENCGQGGRAAGRLAVCPRWTHFRLSARFRCL